MLHICLLLIMKIDLADLSFRFKNNRGNLVKKCCRERSTVIADGFFCLLLQAHIKCLQCVYSEIKYTW